MKSKIIKPGAERTSEESEKLLDQAAESLASLYIALVDEKIINTNKQTNGKPRRSPKCAE